MSIKNYNQPPYYDDFDETKGYYRILFRPGVSVQARELTQMQTQIQAQMDRMGSHFFKDGSRVLGGLPTFDNELDYIKIESNFNYNSTDFNADNYYDEFLGMEITGTDTGVVAKVIDVIPPQDSDPITLFVRYQSAGSNNIDQTFNAEEVFISNGTPNRYGKVLEQAQDPIGVGTRVSVDEGVYFVSGNFVFVEAQSAVINKYSSQASARVVYTVNETIITEADDASLVDNSLGSPNESAPGAHRYSIVLTLAVEDIDSDNRAEDNIIQLGIIKDGIVQEAVRESEYSELMKSMAQRTFEESGNYTVRPFQFGSRDHVGGDPDKLTLTLEPSVAYVKGYRISTLAPTEVELDRSRTSDVFNAAAIQAPVGNYVEVNNVFGSPDIDQYGIVQLFDDPGNVQVGTARIRSIEYVSGIVGTTAAVYRVYLFDIAMFGSNSFSQVDRLQQAGSPEFTCDLIKQGGSSVIYGAGDNSLIFPLPFSTVKTLRSIGAQVDTLYETKITFSDTAAGGQVTLTTGSTDVLFTSTSNADWICTRVSDGQVVDISGNISIGGSPTGTSATITGLADVAYKIVAPVRKNLREKTKSLNVDHNVHIASPNTTGGQYDSLNVCDVYRISAIYMSANTSTPATTGDVDVTDRYDLDDGQRENFYDVGRIRLKRGATAPTGRLLVVLDYFSHGSGDYFAVDSYTIAYEDIPEFDSSRGRYNLRDVIDFRPRKDNTGSDFIGAGSSTVDMIRPGSLITADIQYYLPRRDKLIVNYRGDFKVIKGVPSLTPKYPETPEDAMALYNIEVNPFTFTPSDLSPRIVDNRRYTMRDIGKIDKRVTNLEYYTSLSLLEKETAEAQLFNAAGERFKNGFVVDGFYGHSVGDVTNPDYSCAIDKRAGILRPHFTEDSVRLIQNTAGSTGVVTNGPLVTLPFTEVPYVRQPYASRTENLNPYFVVQYDGAMKISPESDEWKDTETRPELVIDNTGAYDAIAFLADEIGVMGTEWNEWETNWVGRETNLLEESISRRGNTEHTIHQTEAITTSEQSRAGFRTDLTPDTVTTDLGERTVDINFIPYIRSRKVYFRADRLKPNTRLNLYFDGVNLNNFARRENHYIRYSNTDLVTDYAGEIQHPDGAQPLITDASGSITGSFIIPNNSQFKFKTGSRVVRLIDNNNNVETAKTYAEVTYTAQGLMQTKQGTSLSTKVPSFEVSEVSDRRVVTERVVSSKTVSSRVIREEPEPTRVDPLAQTFYVNEPGGIFVTSLDVYMKTKSATSPMIVQLRTVENGYPTTTVIPFSEIVVAPGDVNTSLDASVATTVNFEAPIYLSDQTEYCFVLKALDTGYEAWVSELGGFDVGNVSYRIVDQPHSGVLFKSANAATWTAEQFKDIKFELRRASFDTQAAGTVSLYNADLPSKLLKKDPIITYAGYSTVRVMHRDHGLFENSNVTLSGISTSVNGIPANELNGIHTVTNVEIDSYEITVTTNATFNGRSGGSLVRATQNRLANLIHPLLDQIILPSTDLTWKTRLLTGQSLASPNQQPYNFTDYFDLIANKNMQLSRLHCVASNDNKTFQSDPTSRPLEMIGSMSTTQENLSPVLDLDRASVIVVANRIDNPSDDENNTSTNYITTDPAGNDRFVAETEPTENTGHSRYITRKITLAEAADDLKIFLLANRPSGSNISVYYKIEIDDTPFNDLGWTEVSPDSSITFSEDSTKYQEVEYTLDDIGPFKAFAVKIVLHAQNTSNIPTIKDFRAIALSS